MGQSNSRSQRHAPQNAEPTPLAHALDEAGASEPFHESPAPRRSSLHKRVVNLMTSGSLKRRTADTTTERRKSWRTLRRWSKSLADFYPTRPTVVEDTVAEQPPSSPEASTSRTPLTPSIPPFDKGKNREEDVVELALEEPRDYDDDPAAGIERPSTPYPSTAIEAQQNQNLPAWLSESEQPDLDTTQLSLHGSVARAEEQLSGISETESEAASQPAQVPVIPPVTQEETRTTPAPSQPQPQPQPTRQFPPPGTLVVVQGIVHTTDVSRPNGPFPPNDVGSASRPPTGAGHDGRSGRARGAIQRRSVFTSPSPSSSERASQDHPEPAGEAGTAETSAGLGDYSGSDPAGIAGVGALSETRFPPLPLPPPPAVIPAERHVSPPRSSSISPGSIDVLGTLLSVAAAATAASLLTGSSEPILSSGLAPPSSTSTSATSTATAATTHGAGQQQQHLGGPSFDSTAGSTTASLQNPSTDNYAASRAERMRQAWSTICERLGLRPNPPLPEHQQEEQPLVVGSTVPHLNPNSQQASQLQPEQNAGGGQSLALTDTRELMLAEMARAFNVGLGLNGLGGGAAAAAAGGGPAVSSDDGGEGQHQTSGDGGGGERVPPEGSFDRFLVDLQADLRVALTQGGDDDSDEQEQGDGEERDVRRGGEDVEGERGEVERQQASVDGGGDDDGMPAQESLLDSELEDNGLVSTSHTPPHLLAAAESTITGTSMPTTSTTATNTNTMTNNMGSGSQGRMDASGRINWWRLYRFPAITSPRTFASMPTTSSASTPSSPRDYVPSSAEPEYATRGPTGMDLPSTVSLSDFVEEDGDGNGNGEGEWGRRNEYVVDDVSRTRTRVRRGMGAGSVRSQRQQEQQEQPEQQEAQQQSTFLPNFLPPPSGQTVVPVIVVGLQSVMTAGTAGWQGDVHNHGRQHRQRRPVNGDADADASGDAVREGVEYDDDDDLEYDDEDEDDLEDEWEGEGNNLDDLDDRVPGGSADDLNANIHSSASASGSSNSNSRRWQRRAARVLSHLRSGHGRPARPRTRTRTSARTRGSGSAADDNSTANTDANDEHDHDHGGASGSRTFLIYVIGGYYPPDHSIVTGGPETFETFEALLELAEMLAHVKPPTATKEEIDNSGLETIKSGMLSAYEAKGKIAANCTERCLICLDDYEAEDDVRVMSCRHAFHQVCVDKWLQTGRNNCPACRSTGVVA